ncbi:MAG: YnbE family lipoprotein [Thermodesulfobacteriota bacterium]
MAKRIAVIAVLAGVVFTAGCTTRHDVKHTVDVKPVEVKPIHITIDVNVRVEKALDDFFDDIDKTEKELKNEPEGEI